MQTDRAETSCPQCATYRTKVIWTIESLVEFQQHLLETGCEVDGLALMHLMNGLFESDDSVLILDKPWEFLHVQDI